MNGVSMSSSFERLCAVLGLVIGHPDDNLVFNGTLGTALPVTAPVHSLSVKWLSRIFFTSTVQPPDRRHAECLQTTVSSIRTTRYRYQTGC